MASGIPFFVIRSARNGEFYFTLEAENDEVVATSETYTTKQGAERGIASVKRIAPLANTIDVS